MSISPTTIPISLANLARKTPRRAFLQTCALASSGLFLAHRTTAAAEPAFAPASTDLWEVFKSRRSVRKFKPDAVPEADLRRILDAARSAPTSGNQQPWKFLVVRDPAKIEALKTACIARSLSRADPNKPLSDDEKKRRETRIKNFSENFFSAPVYIVILTDNQSKYADYNHWDGPLAAGYLMLAARALGYGTVFITDAIPDEVTKKVLNIPDRYTRVCITPLGIPVAWPSSPSKKPLEDFIAWETLPGAASMDAS
jgi:nitroreductase